MWKLVYSSRFKKDLKHYKGQTSKIVALKEVLRQLEEKGTVESSYNPHMLAGNYKGCMECHVQNNFLLIWIDESNRTISLVRLGSHSELFK